MNELEMYSRFTQYYIEMVDELRGLASEVEELTEDGQTVPQELANEFFRIETCVNILTQKGKEEYNKTPKELYKEGWDFWIKEDTELREKRYGKK
jgi:hypothetical protein